MQEEVRSEVSLDLRKDGRLTKEIFLNRKDVEHNPRVKLKIGNLEGKYYRFVGNEQHLCNLFNIHSIDPLPNSQVQTSTSLRKEHRRSTQPNLPTD
jgi:hypothetical protein